MQLVQPGEDSLPPPLFVLPSSRWPGPGPHPGEGHQLCSARSRSLPYTSRRHTQTLLDSRSPAPWGPVGLTQGFINITSKHPSQLCIVASYKKTQSRPQEEHEGGTSKCRRCQASLFFRARLTPRIVFPISTVFPSYQLELCFLRTGAMPLSLVEFWSLEEAPVSILRRDSQSVISQLYLRPASQSQEPHSPSA